jgi:hypothetical protein
LLVTAKLKMVVKRDHRNREILIPSRVLATFFNDRCFIPLASTFHIHVGVHLTNDFCVSDKFTRMNSDNKVDSPAFLLYQPLFEVVQRIVLVLRHSLDSLFLYNFWNNFNQ